ncbi:MAG: extracellular solute-binding protein [Rhizobiales bacterium]|nr:extracellular solute-binding protein [Hyphomicrobiales bacterium]
MRTRISRRDALKGGASAAAVLAFPSIARGAKPYEGKTLSVFTYAGSYESTIKTHLVPAFEERTGARVRLDAGWWDMLPKLKASPPGEPVYDVVITDPTQGFPSIKEGLFTQMDPANVPNAKKSPVGMQENWIQKENWGANLAGSAMVMGFHTEAVSDVPMHWHDLLRADLKGKLSMYDAPYQSLYAFAQIKAGQAGNPGGGAAELAKSVDDVLAFAKENREIIRLWWTSTGDFMGKLLAKEIAGGVVHSTGPFGAEDEGKPVKSVLPSEGTAMVHLFWTLTKGSKNKRLAEEWINEALADDFMVKWGTAGKLAVPNLAAAGRAATESPFYKRFLPTDAESWSKIEFYPYDTYFAGNNWEKINDFWTREVLRKS